jgi:putative ABC transport system permease protein
VRLVAVAVVVAAPVAYLSMEQWLADFAYRIDVGVMPFVATGAVVLLAALVTVSTQALRAARLDPVKALRSE